MNFEVVQRAVVLTDLVDSVGLTRTIGDLEFAALMSRLEARIRELIRRFRGREIDKTDGFLIVFEGTLDALEFALALNTLMEEFSRGRSVEMRMRSGLHFGNLVLRRNPVEHVADGAKSLDADGLTKVIAARLTALAEPGQVLITRTLFDIIRENEAASARLGDEVRWLAHGTYLLQGLSDSIEIFEVGRLGSAPLRPPVDKGKARRAILPQDEIVLGWRPATGQIVPSSPQWRVIRKLGEGGYGEVWLAEHLEHDQKRVFKFCFDATRIRSLNREKFLLGVIQETLGRRGDIVSVEDWNTEKPPFFIALQYIPVDNMATWLDKRGGAGTLPLPVILSLVRKTAVALEAAHSVGVLHKDLKPNNLLVGGTVADPHIHLIDFGVGLYAPRTDDETPTSSSSSSSTSGSDRTTLRTSSLAGSRMYLAPEVAEGKLPSVQADLFSLGVLLYQLLRNDLAVGLRVGWERDVADPFLVELIAAATDGDLDKRFKSVPDFIRALDSLEDKRTAAVAREQETRQRREEQRYLEKQKRRRALYAAGLAVAVPMVFVSGVFAIRASRSSAEARAKAEEATETRERANELISFMLQDLTSELRQAGQLPLLDHVTSQTLAYYDEETSETLSNEELYNRAKAFYNLGRVFHDRHEMAEAAESLERAVKVTARLMAYYPRNRNYRKLLADAMFLSATVNDKQSRFENVLPYFNRALELRKDLYEEDPEDLYAALALATSYQSQSIRITGTTGSRLAASALELTAAAIHKARTRPHIFAEDLAQFKYSHATSLLNAGRIIKADRWTNLGEAVREFEELHRLMPDNYEFRLGLLKATYYAGWLQICCGPDMGHMYLRRSAELGKELLAKDYTNREWRHYSARSLAAYGVALLGTDDYEGYYQQTAAAANLLDELIVDSPRNHWIWPTFLNNRMHSFESLATQDKHDQSVRSLQQTVQTIKAAMDKEPQLPFFPKNYLVLSATIALYKSDPNLLKLALDDISKRLETASDDLWNDTNRTMHCMKALLETKEVFEAAPAVWENVTPLQGTEKHATLTAENDTGEVFVVRLYKPGSDTPFYIQALTGHADQRPGRVTFAYFCRGYYGVSVNGSPIATVGSVVETSDDGRMLFKLKDFVKSKGDGMKYRIKIPESAGIYRGGANAGFRPQSYD